MAEGDSIRSGRKDESEECKPQYAKVEKPAVYDDRAVVGVRTGCRLTFFLLASVFITVCLLARVIGRCADTIRRGKDGAPIEAVFVVSTGTAFEDNVVDGSDETVKRK